MARLSRTRCPRIPDEVAFWLYSSGSTGAPKGVRHVHGSLRATAETYGRQVLGIGADDVVFSAAKLFFAYGLGNAMTFPMSVGAVERAAAGAADAGRGAGGHAHAISPPCSAACRRCMRACWRIPRSAPGAGSARLRRCISAGEALPRHIGETWSRVVGVDILDGIGSTEMLHIYPLEPRRRGALRHVGPAGAGLRGEDRWRRRRRGGGRGARRVAGARAERRRGYWNQREQEPAHLSSASGPTPATNTSARPTATTATAAAPTTCSR